MTKSNTNTTTKITTKTVSQSNEKSLFYFIIRIKINMLHIHHITMRESRTMNKKNRSQSIAYQLFIQIFIIIDEETGEK